MRDGTQAERLDDRRIVGDIEGAAGVVPRFVEEQREIERRRTEELRARCRDHAVSERDTELVELNELIRQFNRICPPPLQRPLVDIAGLTRRGAR